MKESEGLYRGFRFLKRAVIGLVLLAGGILGFGYFFFMRPVNAPDAWAAADREIRGGMLHYGERVQHDAKVYQRRASEYYRGVNGKLFETNERVIFVGIAPPDKLQSEDAPAVIISREFPNDTLLALDLRRVYLLSAHGVRIGYTGQQPSTYAAAPGQNAALDSLVLGVNRRLLALRDTARRDYNLRKAVAAILKEPLYYVVRRGDALSLIATRFETTPDSIRKWNNLPNDRVRIGERLLVKPGRK